MKKLYMMVGLPRSGKSTWARQLSEELNAPIVEPDAIREALYGSTGIPFVRGCEDFVWATAKTMVKSLFISGHDNIVLDCCNHTLFFRTQWESTTWDRIFCVVDTPREVCVERAEKLEQDELIPVIEIIDLAKEPIEDWELGENDEIIYREDS